MYFYEISGIITESNYYYYYFYFFNDLLLFLSQ